MFDCKPYFLGYDLYFSTGTTLQSGSGLVVVRRAALRDADRTESLQWLRRGWTVLVHLQRDSLVSALFVQRGAENSAIGWSFEYLNVEIKKLNFFFLAPRKGREHTTGCDGRSWRRHQVPSILQRDPMGEIREARTGTTIQTASGKFLPI